MEEKKLTDEEIVKAWECHIRDGVTCGKDCPYREKDISCLGGRHARDTLDLIHRQKAEIERLTEERHKYFIKATLYYAICKGYGIDNFYDKELEVANKDVEVE